MTVLDFSELLHSPVCAYWKAKYEHREQVLKHSLQTRFSRAEMGLANIKKVGGDSIIEKMTALFMTGFGIQWSPVQVTVFNALVDCILPKIYGAEWEIVASRVMAQRNIKELHQEVLVKMARRNGKTWSVSGSVAALWLCLPGITVACFSVGKRQAGMFLESMWSKVEAAWQNGTIVRASDYKKVQKSKEMIIYEHPSGALQTCGSYPAGVRVSKQIRAILQIRAKREFDFFFLLLILLFFCYFFFLSSHFAKVYKVLAKLCRPSFKLPAQNESSSAS